MSFLLHDQGKMSEWRRWKLMLMLAVGGINSTLLKSSEDEDKRPSFPVLFLRFDIETLFEDTVDVTQNTEKRGGQCYC